MVIKAIHTKQIQDKRRELEISLVAKPGSDICPVEAFQRYPALYKPHAFRRGGIQLVSNFELVRIHSDHASDAIEAYTNLPQKIDLKSQPQ